MRYTFLLLVLCLLVSCSVKKTTVNTTATATTKESSIEQVVNPGIPDCFQVPDPSFEQIVTGCSQGFFKVIGDQFVLRVSPDFELKKGECKEWQIGEYDVQSNVELLIFKKGEASLMNICTGAFNTQAPEPFKRLTKCFGQLTIGRHDTNTSFQKVSIHIDQLIFVNPGTYEDIVIKDQLFWEVADRGMVK
jgi:hypothetical protein